MSVALALPVSPQAVRPDSLPVAPSAGRDDQVARLAAFDQDSVRIAGSQQGHAPQVRLVAPPDSHATDLQGIWMLWQQRAHRASVVEVRTGQDGRQPAVDVEMVGGTWSTGKAASDNNDVTVRRAEVSMPGALTVPGEITVIGLGRREGKTADAMARGTVSIPFANLPAGSAVAVTLNGFNIDTNLTHPEGTTIGGLTARVSNAHRVGNDLLFDYEIGISGQSTPDRARQHLQHGLAADLQLGFTAWVVPGGAAEALTVTTRDTRPAGMHAGPVGFQTNEQGVAIQGQPGLAGGHLGVSGLAIDFDTRDARHQGRYIRGFAFGVAQTGYDAATGQVRGAVMAGYTNAGELARRTRYQIDVDTVLIQSPQAIQRDERETRTMGMP